MVNTVVNKKREVKDSKYYSKWVLKYFLIYSIVGYK